MATSGKRLLPIAGLAIALTVCIAPSVAKASSPVSTPGCTAPDADHAACAVEGTSDAGSAAASCARLVEHDYSEHEKTGCEGASSYPSGSSSSDCYREAWYFEERNHCQTGAQGNAAGADYTASCVADTIGGVQGNSDGRCEAGASGAPASASGSCSRDVIHDHGQDFDSTGCHVGASTASGPSTSCGATLVLLDNWGAYQGKAAPRVETSDCPGGP